MVTSSRRSIRCTLATRSARRSCRPRAGSGGGLAAPVALAAVGPRLRPGLAAREGEAEDRPLDHPQLLHEGAAVVREAIALADVFHLRGDLGVAGRGHVGEEGVLDLVAEVAAGDVEERAALDVGGAGELADVPAAAALVFDLLLGEGVGLVGEVAAEDDRVGPDVADDVGGGVGLGGLAEGLAPALNRGLDDRGPAVPALAPADPAKQAARLLAVAPRLDAGVDGSGGEGADQRPGDVVLDDLALRLAGDPLQLPLQLRLRLLPLADRLEVEV